MRGGMTWADYEESPKPLIDRIIKRANEEADKAEADEKLRKLKEKHGHGRM